MTSGYVITVLKGDNQLLVQNRAFGSGLADDEFEFSIDMTSVDDSFNELGNQLVSRLKQENTLRSKCKEFDEETQNEKEQCIVCRTNKIKILNYPCGHCVSCGTCALKMMESSRTTCCICNAKIEEYVRMFPHL